MLTEQFLRFPLPLLTLGLLLSFIACQKRKTKETSITATRRRVYPAPAPAPGAPAPGTHILKIDIGICKSEFRMI